MKNPDDYYYLYRNAEFVDGKIVLRSLSDMTEEENTTYRTIGVSSHEDDKRFFIYEPEKIRFLLSKHFDIFNLIPEGAIDKTKEVVS